LGTEGGLAMGVQICKRSKKPKCNKEGLKYIFIPLSRNCFKKIKTMSVQTLKIFFQKDLKKLKLEIESYQDEKKIWLTEKRIANSAGNLCLHLVGNLNTYIGAELGKTGYIRNRELEFSQKNIPRIELVKKIEETMQVVEMSLGNMKEELLNEQYPTLVFAEKTTTGYLLMHLATHLAYHLGQINYHRRLLDK
jgi:uncharacterized damage-inducible protein DinB